jgi:hypothetical protein
MAGFEVTLHGRFWGDHRGFVEIWKSKQEETKKPPPVAGKYS